jgi:hypothetical protein
MQLRRRKVLKAKDGGMRLKMPTKISFLHLQIRHDCDFDSRFRRYHGRDFKHGNKTLALVVWTFGI